MEVAQQEEQDPLPQWIKVVCRQRECFPGCAFTCLQGDYAVSSEVFALLYATLNPQCSCRYAGKPE
eukprot:2232224-Prorocentrum_lima.AAC.1